MSDPREEIENDEELDNREIEDIPEDGGEDYADDLSQTTKDVDEPFLKRGLTTK